jgi:hypothetical protein
MFAAAMPYAAEGVLIWPEAVQSAIRSLRPSPEMFLSALVEFWADVALRQLRQRMRQPETAAADAVLAQSWSSPHAALFPMTPPEPPASVNMLRGAGAWGVIERLGPCGELIERQLLACLDHPEPVVWDAAESACGTMERLSDQGFAQFLAVAERRGHDGQLWKRARIAAQHVNSERVHLLLDGLVPGASQELTLPRFAILERLTGDAALSAYRHLLSHLSDAWVDEQRAELIQALTALSRILGFDPQAVAYVRTLIQSQSVDVQCAAVGFLLAHSTSEHAALLLALPADMHPWVASSLCRGLTLHPQIPPELLRLAVSRSLGNYDGYDGEPHNSAIALLLNGYDGCHAHAALAEIMAWWETASKDRYLERETINDALALAEILGAAAAPMKPGMERALALLSTDMEEAEWPALDQPDAIPEIQERLQASMTEAGTPPELASAMSGVYTEVLKGFSENAASIQKEIDDFQAAFEAEQGALYPERLPVVENEASRSEDELLATAEDENQDEGELIVRLRAWLESVN